MYNLTHFSPNSVAGCISNVECSVGGNLELRQTIKGVFLKFGVEVDIGESIESAPLVWCKSIRFKQLIRDP
jgi:hypothetical protein